MPAPTPSAETVALLEKMHQHLWGQPPDEHAKTLYRRYPHCRGFTAWNQDVFNACVALVHVLALQTPSSNMCYLFVPEPLQTQARVWLKACLSRQIATHKGTPKATDILAPWKRITYRTNPFSLVQEPAIWAAVGYTDSTLKPAWLGPQLV